MSATVRAISARKQINPEQYDAVLLDLDGVITNTANLHAACWKEMFDEYLRKRAAEQGEIFRPFDLSTDYRLYVDGKPRLDGVRDFLESRGIRLSERHPTIPLRLRRSPVSETARTSFSAGSSKKQECGLTREASRLSSSSAAMVSKSLLSPRVRTAWPS
jgi:hypothetical protein